MKIAAFAKLVNISTDTLRYYEKLGYYIPNVIETATETTLMPMLH